MITTVERLHTQYGTDYQCKFCGGEVEWQECTLCEDGYNGHDCGEDCCACLDPSDNIVCDNCDGESGWWFCLNEKCKPTRQERE